MSLFFHSYRTSSPVIFPLLASQFSFTSSPSFPCLLHLFFSFNFGTVISHFLPPYFTARVIPFIVLLFLSFFPLLLHSSCYFTTVLLSLSLLPLFLHPLYSWIISLFIVSPFLFPLSQYFVACPMFFHLHSFWNAFLGHFFLICPTVLVSLPMVSLSLSLKLHPLFSRSRSGHRALSSQFIVSLCFLLVTR